MSRIDSFSAVKLTVAVLAAFFLHSAHGATQITPDMVWTGKEKSAQIEEEKRRAAQELQKRKRVESERDAEANRRAVAERENQELKARLRALEGEKNKAVFSPPKYTPGQVFQDDLSGGGKGPVMVVIPASVVPFTMGRDGGYYINDKPTHPVTIGKPFALGKTEVTQGQWKALMGSNPSTYSDCGDDCPVEMVSWVDAQEFIKKLNARTGQSYRLPSEAEWEYACRAGERQEYCGSDTDYVVAWYGDNSRFKTHPTGQKQANAWGLYDMSGNVDEWVEDCYHHSYSGAPEDGSAWVSGKCDVRVVRGGSWRHVSDVVTAASRSWGDVTDGYGHGFRLVRMLR